jgi:WD40 repeat protein/class 3 adenylate cyclase
MAGRRGTVTFLFTDVEGSTRLLKQLRERYGQAHAEHQRILREAFAAHGGEEVDTQGDAFFYVFSRARDAAEAAAAGQRALAAHPWPAGSEFRVRIGMHTGEPTVSDEGHYLGLGVHRTARIMAAGHGGQILVSQATASVLADDEPPGIRLRSLGEHRLKDLDRPEHIYQLDVDGLAQQFPPLRTAADLAARFDVFLSHNSRDKPTVERVARTLRKAGLEPWLDSWHLTPGGDWQREIAEGLRRSGSCAVFVGEADLGDWEQQELGLALDRAATDPRFRVFPVLLPGIPEPFDAHRLPPFLSTRTWVDFRGGYADERVVQRLINAVKGIPLAGEEEPEARPGVCPYRGLQVFEEEHAEFFFGRDADVQRLIELLKTGRFLAVLGPSGSGKSSLVRAGLVPAIRRGAFPGSDAWRVTVLKPGADPLTVLGSHVVDLFPAGAIHDTVDRLESDERTLHLAVGQGMLRSPEEDRVVWVMDQFEEVFTLCRDEGQRRAFIANLLHAGLNPGGRNVVIITMRADFYPKCSVYPELAQAVSANDFLAWPMEEWALAQAIEEPARVVGLELEEGLTGQILSDLREAPGALPLMEHALLELWERRRGTMLTLEAYRQIGGVEGALARRADEVFASLSPAEQSTARRVLLRLTQPGEGTEDTRRRASMTELAGRSEEREAVERVVAALTDARLLTAGTDEKSREQWVDVSHEALIRGWPRLRGWLEEDRAGLRTHRRVTEAAQEWDRLDRDPDALYRGARLAAAAEWAERNRDAMNEIEEEFLRESVDAEERARRGRVRRLRVAAGGLGAGLIVVAVLAIVAFLQMGRADEQERLARSREVAALAAAQLDSDPELSLLLAIEANRIARTIQAESALRNALLNYHVRTAFRYEGSIEPAIDVSPDGSIVATGSEDGTAALWDLDTGKRLALMKDDELKGAPATIIGQVALSPDGTLLLTAHGDGRVRIWRVPGGDLVSRFDARFEGLGPPREQEVRGPVPSAAWMPDGEGVITGGGDGNVLLWEASSGRVLETFPVAREGLVVATLSPDGLRMAVGPEKPRRSPSGIVPPVLRVIDVSGGETVSTMKGHRDLVLWREFSPEGELLLTASTDHTARVWDVDTGRTIHVLRHDGEVLHVTMSPDGTGILTTDDTGQAFIWDARTGKVVVELSGQGTAEFSPDGRLAITASSDGVSRVWDVATGQTLAVLAGGAAFGGAEFTPDGRTVVTGGDDVRAWDVGAVRVLSHGAPVTQVSFSPDGRSLVSGGVDGTARVWDLETQSETAVLEHEPGAIVLPDFGPDGDLVVTAGGPWSPVPEEFLAMPTRIWRAADGKLLIEIPVSREDPLDLCLPGCDIPDADLSPDGSRVAAAGRDGFLRIYDTESGDLLRTIEVGESLVGVEWSPDGRAILTEPFLGSLRLYDASSGEEMATLGRNETDPFGPPPSGGGPDFSSDGALIATRHEFEGVARVWDARTGRLVAEFPHDTEIWAVRFSPDGRLLVTASGETVTVWDVASGQRLVELPGHEGPVLTVDFSPDGSLIASGGDDGTIRIQRCEVCAPLDQLLRLARERVTRDLTPAERARFLHEG